MGQCLAKTNSSNKVMLATKSLKQAHVLMHSPACKPLSTCITCHFPLQYTVTVMLQHSETYIINVHNRLIIHVHNSKVKDAYFSEYSTSYDIPWTFLWRLCISIYVTTKNIFNGLHGSTCTEYPKQNGLIECTINNICKCGEVVKRKRVWKVWKKEH